MAEVAAAFGIVIPAFKNRSFLLGLSAEGFLKMTAQGFEPPEELMPVFLRCKEILDGEQRLQRVSGKSPLELHRCDSKDKT